jgi:hypothetical protein
MADKRHRWWWWMVAGEMRNFVESKNGIAAKVFLLHSSSRLHIQRVYSPLYLILERERETIQKVCKETGKGGRYSSYLLLLLAREVSLLHCSMCFCP